MSDSVRPHRRQPTRLPRPWDSPGKDTGVGCHFLLQCMKVKSESEVAQSCLTLSNPMDCSLPGSSVHGIFQTRVLGWGATAFSRTDDRYILLFCEEQSFKRSMLMNLLSVEIQAKPTSVCSTSIQPVAHLNPCILIGEPSLQTEIIFSSFN